MTVLAITCFGTLVATMSGDLFVPAAHDTEVWFGFEVTGPMAFATAPIHWAIFATGAWAFWTERPWAPVAGACYLVYVALCHLVWSVTSAHGRGLPIGLAEAAVFVIAATLLARARRP
jgi:hypothetical protein